MTSTALATAMPSTDLDVFTEAKRYHPTPESEFIYYEKYSRWNYDLGRRETWPETVQRAVDYLEELADGRLPAEDREAIHAAILRMDVLPSMRLMAMAGDAARRSHITLYNCSALPIDSFEAFVEAMVLSMSGTGVGYSVEEKFVRLLPVIQPQKEYAHVRHVIEDSAEGWADALRLGLACWGHGFDVDFDYSLVRPRGAILRTKGGRASGPEPLRNILDFVRATFLARQGSKLSALDCHDIMGNIALGVVSGGVRRSAMIALYSWDDQSMRHCKDGEFWKDAPWRTTANNSAVLGDPALPEADLRSHLDACLAGGNGEPGIFSRVAANVMRPDRRQPADFLTNPCAEISLRPRSFCNLSEVILRPWDTRESIMRKTRLATIIGTIQACATNFPGLPSAWSRNAEDERLLGVGYTGQMDCPTFQDARVMDENRMYAEWVNIRYATRFGIKPAAAITCVKPSGSTSILTNSSAGLHDRWARHYIRRFRLLDNGPLARVLEASGFVLEADHAQPGLVVASFPVAAPEVATVRNDRSALEQMEYWKLAKIHLTEHNPSVTITYKPDEIDVVKDWVIENRACLGGMAFLPHFDESIGLPQMPYETIDEMEYEMYKTYLPTIDYSLLTEIEAEDQTTAAQEVACSAGACMLE